MKEILTAMWNMDDAKVVMPPTLRKKRNIKNKGENLNKICGASQVSNIIRIFFNLD